MTYDLFPGLTGDERMRAIRRHMLMGAILELSGVPVDPSLDTPALYGIRDRLRRKSTTAPRLGDKIAAIRPVTSWPNDGGNAPKVELDPILNAERN